MRIAAIDIGTNSVLLTVAEAGPDGLRAVVERAEITRLGQGVDATGRLSEEGMARTVAVLKRYAAEARALGAQRIACVATSAARDAANGGELLNRIGGLALTPEIIAGEREAQLVYRAARADFGGFNRPLAVVDIGGGSTEIVFGRGPDFSFRESLDLGSVRLTERLVREDPPAPDRPAVRAAAEGALREIPPPPSGADLVGVAGTVTTLATLALGLDAYDAARVHGATLERSDLERLCDRLWALPLADRRRLPGLQPGRADVLPAGAQILLSVLERLNLPRVLASDRGVRWGLLRELAEG